MANPDTIQAQQESALCRVNSQTNCPQGTSVFYANSQCRTWYLNPTTGEWSLTGDPKWLTRIGCLVTGEVIYTNAVNVPVIVLAPPETSGKLGKTNLGEQVCISYFDCDCGFPVAQVGSACQLGALQLENKIIKEEITGDDCTGGCPKQSRVRGINSTESSTRF